jgi:uncharacterized iron-regulated membrane protein
MDATNPLRRWLDHPQRAPGRRLLFQVHLWIGVVMAVYVVVISVSGSAVVFRRELDAWLVPRSVPAASEARLEGEAPDNAFPPALRALEWLVDLHDNLLAGSAGRRVNGVASALVAALVLTGAIVWWPGRGHWRRSLLVPRPSRTRRFVWHLHSALGFWSFALLCVWAVTGVYFAFPRLFDWFALGAEVDGAYVAAPGEKLMLTLIDLHFGRFGGLGMRIAWTVLGLAPAALVVTGLILWWRRVLKPALRSGRATAASP